MLVILIGLFFRQWFTHFCDIYVFLLQFRRKKSYFFSTLSSPLTIYRSFIRPHLDYCDVIYDQPHKEGFCSKIESVQYNAALSITGAIKGTSRNRLYQELGLESLSDRRLYRRLVHFFNIVHLTSPKYLFDLLPEKRRSLNPQRSELFTEFFSHSAFFDSFFSILCQNMEQIRF